MNYYIPTPEQLKGLLDGSITQFRVPIKDRFGLMGIEEYIKLYGTDNLLKHHAPYQKDQIIYCKEAFQLYHWNNEKVAYKANGEDARYRDQISAFSFNKWRSPIHMTKDQARLWLRITDTRVERVQKITIGDIKKEGLDVFDILIGWDTSDVMFAKHAEYWNERYAKKGYGFYSNCLTQVCSVERMEG